MRIGIELNNIVRDLNKQIIKYYKKDIDKKFDDKNIDYNKPNIAYQLPFKKQKERDEFLYVDYAYEIFGCARAMHRNLPPLINNFMKDLENVDDNTHEMFFFSLLEEGLTIQSTFFFLSKIGSRVRKMFFPKDGKDMWKECDVIITTNERIISSKPEGKVVVYIGDFEKGSNDTINLQYETLIDAFTDEDFITKVKQEYSYNEGHAKPSFITKLRNKIFK